MADSVSRPPPYQAPPIYYNTLTGHAQETSQNLTKDPFDTSDIPNFQPTSLPPSGAFASPRVNQLYPSSSSTHQSPAKIDVKQTSASNNAVKNLTETFAEFSISNSSRYSASNTSDSTSKSINYSIGKEDQNMSTSRNVCTTESAVVAFNQPKDVSSHIYALQKNVSPIEVARDVSKSLYAPQSDVEPTSKNVYASQSIVTPLEPVREVSDKNLSISRNIYGSQQLDLAKPSNLTNAISNDLNNLNSDKNSGMSTEFMTDLDRYLKSKNKVEREKNTNQILQGQSLPPLNKSEIGESQLYGNLPADTASAINRMWYESTQNINQAPKENNVAACTGSNSSYVMQTEYGEFKSNRRYDPVYSSTCSNLNASRYGTSESANSNSLYANQTQSVYGGRYNGPETSSLYSTRSSYGTQVGIYGSSSEYSGRGYSEVSDGIYSEIPDHVYSQVPVEVLRPHRPAPGSPVGQPQSMQQIQRKIQKGIVSREFT